MSRTRGAGPAGFALFRERPNAYDDDVAAEKTSALVIRLADFSESSRVATLFTRDFGKVAVLAKGAKRLKGPFEAALDLLTQCEVVFLRKSSAGLDILTEAKLTKRFRQQGGNLARLYGGYYIAELLDALSEPYDSHPALFDEACLALDSLSGNGPLDLVLLRFEFAILREIGQLPAFGGCVACERSIDTASRFTWKVSQGGLICEHCLIEPHPSSWISLAAAAQLNTLSNAGPEGWRRLAPFPAQAREVRAVMNSAIAHVLGRRPKMLRYLPF